MAKVAELCPRCGSLMENGRKPLHIRGTYVGTFDAIACPICQYRYFPDEVYDQILAQGLRFGVIGPPILENSVVSTIEEMKLPTRLEGSTNQPKVRIERKQLVSVTTSTNGSTFSTTMDSQKRIVEAPVTTTVPEQSQ